MSISSCPKCAGHYFELVIQSPSKSNFKLSFIQCSSCGVVVGVMDYNNIGARLDQLEKKIDSISMQTRSTSSVLDVINTNIGRLFNLIQSKK